METKAVVYNTWDDMIFENRNKAYGAYVLRKSYDRKVMLGFGITMALLALLLMLATSADEKPYIPPFKDLSDKGEIIFEVKPEIIPIKRDKPKAQQRQTVVEKRNTPPIVTSQPVEHPALDIKPSDAVAEAPTGGSEGVSSDIPVSTGGGVEAIDHSQTIVDVHVVTPEYEGGEKALYEFIRKKIRYPRSARMIGVDGTVFVSFIVRPDGSVTDVNVLRGFHPDCDKEAARVIGMLPGWRGAKQAGYPVSVRMILPIKFVLPD